MTDPAPAAVTTDEPPTEPKTSPGRGLLNSMHPKFFFSMADGYPVGVKQFLQFCLLLIYPGWLIAAPLCAAIYFTGYELLWILFWPLRAWMKKNRPAEYAASQLK